MIQFGLYFALGFLVAGFLALLVAPAIWRRAVFLTRKRIESAVPLTANELQADKDKLRAEHAMGLRKVELALEKQRTKTTAQATKINDLEEQIKLANAEAASQREANGQLSKTIALGETKLSARDEELQDTKFQLSTTSAELSARTGELESLNRLYKELEEKLADGALREKDNALQIAKLTATVSDLRAKRQDDQAKVRENRSENKATAELLKNERGRAKELETKYERLVSQKSDVEDKLSRREKEIVRLREKKLDEEADVQEIEQRFMDSEAERAALEKEVTALTLKLNRIEKVAGSENPEKAMEALQVKIAKLDLDLQAAREQRDDFKKQLSAKPAVTAAVAGAAQAVSKSKTGDNDEALRENLKQLAAEVVHMTALVEGDGSRINAILKDAPAGSKDGSMSLAQRIEALKKAAAAAQ